MPTVYLEKSDLHSKQASFKINIIMKQALIQATTAFTFAWIKAERRSVRRSDITGARKIF